MHDFDLAEAPTCASSPTTRTAGTLALVVRDTLGGVAWHLWPITVQ